MDRTMLRRARQQAILAAIARREWLLQMLALGAAGCRRAEDRAYSRGNTLIAGVSENSLDDRPLRPDYLGERLVFLPLVRANEQGEREPCLATEWTHSADYREWTYRLRPGVRWHDGRPVTMDDVTFTLELHSRPDSPYTVPLTESVTVHDASTFTVRGTLDWTRQSLWFGFSGQDSVVSILPKHLVQDLDLQKFYEWDFWLRPVGNGPYRYLRHQPGSMVELEANPGYYKGTPRIARVVLKFTGEASLTELLSGNVDAIQLDELAQLPALTNDPRFQMYWPNPGQSWAIVWQNEHPLFRDREVRRALSLAINRRELLQILNLPSQFSRVDGINTVRQFQRGEGSEPRYDPAEARRLLDNAGWRLRNRDGLRERDGQDFRFTALTLAESPGAETALYVQDQLRDLGVRMELQQLERSARGDRLRTGKFEAIVSFINGGFRSVERWAGGAGYRNPQLTRLLELVRNTADPEAADQAYRTMSDLWRADQPVAFLFLFSRPGVVHRRVKGLTNPWRADPLRFTDDLWLEDRPTD